MSQAIARTTHVIITWMPSSGDAISNPIMFNAFPATKVVPSHVYDASATISTVSSGAVIEAADA
jgi:hypothetical protein